MTDTPSRTLPVGTRIGVYEIRRVLGVGQVGISYKVWNKHLNSSMVLKEYYPPKLVSRAADGCTVIPKPAADKTLLQSGLESFLTEAEHLIGLEHPNLVRVQNMLQLYGTAYQLMEYENGVALSDLIARPETSLDEDQLKVILMPILEALQEVHGAGFFHGDIHPGNILLRADGNPILLEFAATRLAMAASSVQRSWVVTEGYAPAEQYDPERPMGPWTDLYAMAATMSRCITGEVPVSGPERLAALANGVADPQRSLPTRAVAGYSEGFLDCIDAMLNPIAEKRPPSAAAILALLADGEQAQANKDLKAAPKGSTGAKDIDSIEPPNRISVPAMAGVGMGVVALVTAGLFVAQIETADVDRKSEIPAETSIVSAEAFADDPVVLIDTRDVQVADEVVTDVSPETVVETELEWPTEILQPESSLVLLSTSSQDGEDAPSLQTAVSASSLQQEVEVISETQPLVRIDVTEDALVSVEQNAPDIPSVMADETSKAVTGVVSAQQDTQQQEGVHDFVTGRMALAEQDLLALRLTTPQGNNALEHYRDVLALLPEHSGAMAGLQRIVDMYTRMIDTALQENQLVIAQLYLTRAQEVIPGAPSLLQAKQDLRSVDVEATHE
ncbi:MAG: protein kinase [Pseudomonadota bacterium]